MKTPTKFVKPLTSEQREQLKEIMKSSEPQRKRMRAHAGADHLHRPALGRATTTIDRGACAQRRDLAARRRRPSDRVPSRLLGPRQSFEQCQGAGGWPCAAAVAGRMDLDAGRDAV